MKRVFVFPGLRSPICIYWPCPPICVYRPWPQFVFNSPGPEFVFTGPGLYNLLFTSSGQDFTTTTTTATCTIVAKSTKSIKWPLKDI